MKQMSEEKLIIINKLYFIRREREKERQQITTTTTKSLMNLIYLELNSTLVIIKQNKRKMMQRERNI